MKPGDRLGRYRLEALVGAGGMGEVYRAHDTELGRDVAIKVVGDASNAELTKRMRREARAASAFAHPNVATIFDVSEHEGRPFIVMELVVGRSLRALLSDGALSGPKKTAILIEVARALAAAHDRGLVHRDVKPDNIVVRDDGCAKLLDFGIAKLTASAIDASAPTEASSALTRTGAIVGSPAYMAPEQIQGREVDERADQFSWAVTAFELFAGRLPWKSQGTTFEVAASILHEEPLDLKTLDPAVAPAMVAVIARAMSKAPAARFEDMHALLEALEAPPQNVGQAVTSVEPAPSLTSRQPEKRGTPWMPISLGLAALAGGWLLLQSIRRSGEVDQAATPAPVTTRVVLGLNDEATLRRERDEREGSGAAGAAKSAASPASSPAASASGKPPRPPVVRCADDQKPECQKENFAWCDAAGARLACCVKGLVARADGRCECAPGGVTSEALQKGGCTAAASASDNKAALQRTVRTNFGGMRTCYEAALKKNPKIAGNISVRFRISPNGRVYDASLAGTSAPDPDFQDCVVAVFERLEFPPPADGSMVVDYPMSFSDG